MSLPDFVKKLIVLGQLNWRDGNIFLNGERAVIFRADILSEMQHDMCSLMGTETTADFMRRLGRNQAESAFKRYAKNKIDSNTGNDEAPLIKMGRTFLEITGWGLSGKYVWFGSRNKVVGSLKNSTIALSYVERYGKQDGPVCHFIAGILDGGFSHAGGKGKLRFVEKSCVACGDPECTFEGNVIA